MKNILFPKSKKDVIKSQLNKLVELSQESFANYQINQDPICGKIPERGKKEIINSSIACGEEEAEKLLKQYGQIPPFNIAQKLGIKVEYKDEQSPLDFVYFGLYESPNHITIYENNIRKATKLLEALDLNFFEANFNDIVLAHEIFHYIEDQDETLYSNTKKIKLWSLGNLYTHTSKLICTGEIAGMSFSKKLIGLDFDPNILDYIFLVAFDFEKADKLFRKMMQ